MARGHILKILSWAFWAVMWLLSLGILAFATVYYSPLYPYLLLDLLVGGIVVAVFGAVFAFIPSRKAVAVIEEWEDAMLPFIYTIKFELLPVMGSDRLIDVWNRYKGIYRAFTDENVPSSGSRFLDSTKLRYNYQARGKKERHTFAIYASNSDFVLMVRRFAAEEPVGRGDIARLKEEAEDVLDRVNPDDFRVGAFSRSGFTEDAIAFCKSEEGRILEGPAIDLVRETETGYAIVFVTAE